MLGLKLIHVSKCDHCDAYWYTVTNTGTISTVLCDICWSSLGSASTILISCFLDAIIHSLSTTRQNIRARPLQFSGLTLDDQESVWSICLDVLGDIQLLLNVFWTTWAETQRPLRLIRPILIPDTARNLFPLVIRKRARSSFNAIDFSRCPPQATHSPSHRY